jgi:hypothetical protein
MAFNPNSTDEFVDAAIASKEASKGKSELKAFMSWAVANKGEVIMTEDGEAYLASENMNDIGIFINSKYPSVATQELLSLLDRYMEKYPEAEGMPLNLQVVLRPYKAKQVDKSKPRSVDDLFNNLNFA